MELFAMWRPIFSFFVVITPIFCQSQFDSSTCGQQKGCLFSPVGCTPNSNCRIQFSYLQSGSSLEMELSGQVNGDGYIAVGFSNDAEMGDDTVVYCRQRNGAVESGLAYNPGKSDNLLNPNGVQTPRTANSVNNNVYCSLSQLLNPNVPNVKDLNGIYYILMATGGLNGEGGLTYHQTNRYVLPRTDLRAYVRDSSGRVVMTTADPSLLLQDGEKTSTDKLKIAHGILMVLGWGIFLSTGIIFARHFRGHWPETTFLGVKMWFNFHRGLNTIGLAATIAGFAVIFAALDWRWQGPSPGKTSEENNSWGSVHSMIGLLACVIAWAQPLNAVFRCDNKSKVRFIFNWIHRFFGCGAFVLALSAVMIACVHFKTMFSNRDAALGLWIAYVSMLGLTLIAMEILSLRKWWINRSRVDSEMEMVRIGGTHVSYMEDETNKTHRILLLLMLLFIGLAIGLCVPICILIGLKPNPVPV